jgi:hypothetical protein
MGWVSFTSVLTIPDKPPLAQYENPPQATGNDLHHAYRKTGFLGALTHAAGKVVDEMAACDYAIQNGLRAPCGAREKYELDGDANTLEVLVLEGEQAACPQAGCNLWLVQLSPEQIQYNKSQSKQADQHMPVQATKIGQWQAVTLPVTIKAAPENGWQPLDITHADGTVTHWHY